MTIEEALAWAERHTELSMGCLHKEAFNTLCAEVRRLQAELAAAREDIAQIKADAKTVGETASFWCNRAEDAEAEIDSLRRQMDEWANKYMKADAKLARAEKVIRAGDCHCIQYYTCKRCEALRDYEEDV